VVADDRARSKQLSCIDGGFLEVWDESEPKFAEYFRECYTNRVGELHITLFEQLLICRYNRKVGWLSDILSIRIPIPTCLLRGECVYM